MRSFRFSFNIFGLTTARAFAGTCRQGEGYGYHSVFAADHLGLPAPFPLLVAAAQATSGLRLGTLVLNAGFWNAALLAREIATTDILTDGRLEVGIGAGHMKWEFDEAGIAWPGFEARAGRLSALIGELRRHFAGELPGRPEGVPRLVPVQRHGFAGTGPPLIVGGTGDRILRIAAAHADIVGVAGVFQIPGQPPGTFRLATAAEADERVGFARACAGARADQIEWHLLVQAVIVTGDRQAAAENLVAERRRMAAEQGADPDQTVLTVGEALRTPYLLIGTADEIAAQLRASRERWGFSYVTVHEPFMPALAPVIERLRGE
ncbi:MAG TPA: TIGR03621 family F420-dependent LLM class oxidoreductase [Streptosporangiaceae bacterium]